MMKRYRRIRQLCTGLICVIVVLSMSIHVQAQEQIDLNRNVSATVILTAEDIPVPEAVFHIYRAAVLEADGSAALTGDFAGYPVSLEENDFNALGQTLAGYVRRDGIKPEKSAVTDDSGTAVFADGLTPGLYLILGDDFTLNGRTCSVEPSLIQLPGWDGNAFRYDITMYPKWEIQEQYDSMTVFKVWEDEGFQEKRPEQIQASLIDAATGEVWGEAELNAENNWRHTWDNLPEGHSWLIAEQKVPGDYTVTVSRDGNTVILKNVYQNPPDDPHIPENPDTPDDPDTPDGPHTPGNPDTPETSSLPRTGTLKWLVPILAFCGMALFVTGWLWRRRDGEN